MVLITKTNERKHISEFRANSEILKVQKSAVLWFIEKRIIKLTTKYSTR